MLINAVNNCCSLGLKYILVHAVAWYSYIAHNYSSSSNNYCDG